MKRKFQSWEEAMKVMEMAEEGSDEWIEAFDYCFKHGPEEFRTKIREGFRQFFPNVKMEASHYDDQGRSYFSIEEIKQKMGLSDAEVEKLLQKADEGDLADPAKLHKKQ